MQEELNILVVDDEQIILDLFSRVLDSKGYRVTTARSGQQAIEEVKKAKFDIIFMDVVMPEMNGLETYQKLKEIDPQARTIMMTGYSVEEIITQALLEGVQDCLHKPFDIEEISKSIKEIMEEKAHILVVDDEQIILDLFSRVLGDKGYQVTTARSGQQAIEEVEKAKFDVIFMDVVMAEMNGLETYQKIKEIDPQVQTIMMTGYSVGEMIEQALLAGVQDCLRKPFDIGEITKSVADIMEKKAHILMVDDEQVTLDLFSRVLGDKGYQVTTARSGQQAIEEVKKQKFDIIFLDVAMPGVDGPETRRRIKEIDPKARTIMMTGYTAEGLIEQALSEGIRGSSHEPFDIVEMMKTVQKVMEKRANILIVDDKQANLNLFSRVLGSEGYRVTTARSGQQAIEEVKKQRFDIVFLDVVMPGMDGLETYRRIKKIDPRAQTVMMSSYLVEDIMAQALSEGVRECLRKPFDIMEIMKIFSKVPPVTPG